MMKSGQKSGHAHSTTAPSTVEEYLSGIPEPARDTLEKVRAIIRSVLPADTAEVISYRMPAFKHGKVLLWYAAFSEHWSLFPSASVIQACREDLKRYRVSKGTIQFPIDEPPPAVLIKKLAKARLAQLK
jgi:uncharacterized protein YdhG (YjbR/CyaY superfamily)